MEQSPVYVGVSVRHFIGERHARGLHPGGGGPDPESTQSGPLGMQSIFRGKLCSILHVGHDNIVSQQCLHVNCFALINIPVFSY